MCVFGGGGGRISKFMQPERILRCRSWRGGIFMQPEVDLQGIGQWAASSSGQLRQELGMQKI